MREGHTLPILFFLLIFMLLPLQTVSGSSPELSWLKPGVYARYTVLLKLGENNYKQPSRIQMNLPISDSDIVRITKGKYMAKKISGIVCSRLVYEWRVISVNSTWARVQLELTMYNVTLSTEYHKLSTSGVSQAGSNITHYSRINIVRDVYVRLSDGIFFYKGFKGKWPYWLSREELSNSTIIILTNITLPAIYPTPHIYMALDVRGPASLYGYNHTVRVSNYTIGPERLAVAASSMHILTLLRMLGLKVPKNATEKDAFKLLYKYQDIVKPMPYAGRLWYDMSTGVMVQASMKPTPFIGYDDDVLYWVMGVAGFFPVEYPPLQRHPWVFTISDTNLRFNIVVLGGESQRGISKVVVAAAVLLAVLLAFALWWRYARR